MQLKKSLVSAKSLDYPIVFWNYNDNPFSALQKIINKIISEFGPEKNILLLGRTTYDAEMVKESGLFSICVILFMVIESSLFDLVVSTLILTELNHFFYTLGLTSIVTLQ